MSFNRRIAAGGIACAAVIGIAVSFAASLNITGSSLGAGTTVVGSCEAPGASVNVAFNNAYAPAIKGYQVTTVELQNLSAACAGLHATLTLTDSTGASLFQDAATVAGATLSLPVPAGVAASDVSGAAVVIAG